MGVFYGGGVSYIGKWPAPSHNPKDFRLLMKTYLFIEESPRLSRSLYLVVWRHKLTAQPMLGHGAPTQLAVFDESRAT